MNISNDVWAKAEFYELDRTIDLVQNKFQGSQNGFTRMKHNIKYAKNGQVINVIFDSEKHQ